jgi:hypothetical protein
MMAGKRKGEAVYIAAVLALVLLVQFLAHLLPGHYLYLAMIEDPGARYSWFPWDLLAARELRSGHFPLWDPYSGTGMPLLANYHSALLFPLKLPYYLLPWPRVLDLMVILRLALAGGFTFALARELGRSRPAAALAAAAFTLCGYLMKFMNVAHVSNEMWLPLILLLVLRRRRGGGRWALPAAAAAWGAALLGGNPEAAFYIVLTALLFTAALAAGARGGIRLALAGLVAPLAVGGLLAAAQELPLLEYLPLAWHVHDPGLHLTGEASPRFLWGLVAPWLLGPSGSNPSQLTAAPYVGSVVLLLAGLGLAAAEKKSRLLLFCAGTGALLLAVSYRLPPLGLLSWLPPFNRSGNIKFAFLPLSLILALLAGGGLDAVLGPGFRARKATLPLAFIGIILVGGALHCRFGLGEFHRGWLLPPFFGLLAGAVVLVWAGQLRRDEAADAGRVRRRRAAAVLAGLGLAELMLDFHGFQVKSKMLPAYLTYRRPAPPAALARAAQDPARPRFTGVAGALHPNLNVLAGLYDLRAFEALYPRAYVETMAAIEGFPMAEAVPAFFRMGWMFEVRPERLGSPWLNQLGVKYAVGRPEFAAPGWERVEAGSTTDYEVYLNPNAYPRAWVEQAGLRGPAEVSDYRSDRVALTASGPGTLVLSDTYFPGWIASVDGQAAPIAPHDRLLRAVVLGPGRHEVVMSYRPWGFRVGIWMSLVTAAMTIFVAVNVVGPQSRLASLVQNRDLRRSHLKGDG